MRIFVELRDKEGDLHRDFEWTFRDQGNISELKDKIKKMFHIDHRFQELWFNGARIGADTVIEAGMKDKEICVVKHSAMSHWNAFLSSCDHVNNTTAHKNARKASANLAIQFSKILESSGFVLAYSKFMEKYIEKRGQAMRFARPLPSFEQSAIAFFEKQDPESKVEFEPKSAGIMEGTIAKVMKGDTVTRYYLKTYHRTVSTPPVRFQPNPLEILLYRILNFIDTGPIVYFPSEFIMTKEVDGFEVVEKVEDEELKTRIVVEAYILRLILGIKDLHGENFGVDKRNKLSIIDFCPPQGDNFRQRDIINDFKNANRIDNFEINEILKTVGPERRIEIGRATLERLSGIREVTSSLIDNEKEILRTNGIKYETDDIEYYIKNIKDNFETLREGLQ